MAKRTTKAKKATFIIAKGLEIDEDSILAVCFTPEEALKIYEFAVGAAAGMRWCEKLTDDDHVIIGTQRTGKSGPPFVFVDKGPKWLAGALRAALSDNRKLQITMAAISLKWEQVPPKPTPKDGA